MLPWSLGSEWLFRSVHRLPDQMIHFEHLKERLERSNGPVAFPSHVLRYPWFAELLEYCQKSPDRYSWQAPLGDELFDLWPNLKLVVNAGMKVEYMAIRAPSNDVFRFLECENASEFATLVYLPTVYFNPVSEISRIPPAWKSRMHISFIPQGVNSDQFLSAGEVFRLKELLRLRAREWNLTNMRFHEYISEESEPRVSGNRRSDQTLTFWKFVPLVILANLVHALAHPLTYVLNCMACTGGLIKRGYYLTRRVLATVFWPVRKLYWFSEYQVQKRILKRQK